MNKYDERCEKSYKKGEKEANRKKRKKKTINLEVKLILQK